MIYVTSGGATSAYASIVVTYPAGSVCTCVKGNKTLTAKNTTGKYVFSIPQSGTWRVKSVKGSNSVYHDVAITTDGQVELVELSYISSVLNNNSWELIDSVSSQGANYWSVGDCKAVKIQGTVGKISINTTYYVYILGFNHNGATGIDFGTFKTALSSGVDICLTDEKVQASSTDGTKYFNMNHSLNKNTGGWKSCDLRYDILGSTNVDSGNAGATTATKPVANTLMAALPSDLRAVLKPMTIYTDNVGGATNVIGNVTSSVDYLPLLAEYEVFGTCTNANSYEKQYQLQYTYFAAGNSKLKYRHTATTTKAVWLTRSPYYNNATQFCLINTSAATAVGNTSYSRGLAPCFRV